MSDPISFYSHQSIDASDEQAVLEVLRSDMLTQGPKVEEFERAIADYLGAKHVMAVSSGTAALHLALLAHGVGSGDKVVVPSLTFAATANAALYCGATPIFSDVCEDKLSACDSCIENADMDSGTTANMAIAMDFAGYPDMRIPRHKLSWLPWITDAAHSFGAEYGWWDGRRPQTPEWSPPDGTRMRVGAQFTTCFSFHPLKSITTGEGGAVVTDDGALSERVRRLRNHGRWADGGQQVDLGFNYRMSDINAALGISQLKRIDSFIAKRRALSLLYVDALAPLIGDGRIKLPTIDYQRSACHLFPVLVQGGKRDAVKRKMQAAGIGVQVHYDPIVPLQPYYRERFGYREGMWPVAEAAAKSLLSLPLHPGLRESDVQRVVEVFRESL